MVVTTEKSGDVRPNTITNTSNLVTVLSLNANKKMYCISLISPPLLKDEIAFVEGEQSIDKPKSRKTFLFIITLIN